MLDDVKAYFNTKVGLLRTHTHTLTHKSASAATQTESTVVERGCVTSARECHATGHVFAVWHVCVCVCVCVRVPVCPKFQDRRAEGRRSGGGGGRGKRGSGRQGTQHADIDDEDLQAEIDERIEAALKPQVSSAQRCMTHTQYGGHGRMRTGSSCTGLG